MSSFFRIISPLRLHTLNSVRQPRLPTRFFAASSPSSSLRYGGHKVPQAQPVARRTYHQGSAPRMDDSQTNMYILYGFIGINCGVFAYTSYVKEQARQGNMQPFTKFYRNFTLNLHSVLDEHRYWTLLTNTFTHGGFMHLLGNMFSLFFMGRLVAQTPGIGPLAFVTLAIGSGLAGSAGYLYQRWLKTQGSRMRDNRHGLGFSGAVMGVGTAAACMYPKVTFLIYGIVPMPLWALMAGYMVYDGFYLNSDRNTGTAHAGHIGGAAFGALYYFLKLRRGIFV